MNHVRALHRDQYEYFRALLVKARKESGLSQVQIAEKLGKPQSYVSKCERGERRVDFAEFVDFADVLGLDVAEFAQKYRDASRSPVIAITPRQNDSQTE